MGKRGEGQDAGNRLKMKVNLQKSLKRTLAEAEAAVEELIVFQGLITAQRCTWHGSVLTPVHLLPLMQSQIQERELTGEDGRLLCIHVFLEAIHYLLVKCTQKLLEPEKETTEGLIHELQKLFFYLEELCDSWCEFLYCKCNLFTFI